MNIEAQETYTLINYITRLGYAVWIRRMSRVPFGVMLKRAGRRDTKAVTVYAGGETLTAALQRALLKAANRQEVQP